MNLEETICLGVAGNFAHHLEQAGELEDFKNVVTKEVNAPKGIFPFYLPGVDSFLGLYSIGTDTLTLPSYEANAQVEPEIAVLFDISYNSVNEVVELQANKFTCILAIDKFPYNKSVVITLITTLTIATKIILHCI